MAAAKYAMKFGKLAGGIGLRLENSTNSPPLSAI